MGIGIQNVQERLKVLYGGTAHMNISSGDGIGTLITIELPLLDEAAASALTPVSTPQINAPARYAVRPSTLR
jgi:signal transduction histidine kinase